MKRTVLALTLILALLFSAVAGMQFVNLAKANPIGTVYPWNPHPIINVLSPINQTTITTSNVTLTFALNLSEWYNYSPDANPNYTFTLDPIEYYLDGKLAGQITGHLSEEAYNLSDALVGLTDGLHSVEVTATTSGQYWIQNGDSANLVNGVTNGSSGKIFFNVKSVETFPSTLVAFASAASVAIVGLGLLVYFNKRKRQVGK